ncbi:unnamed protein product [Lactuca virosa]|uniref:Uncharacterized protein n=1 Tax=Lactuca virosa TaxID=75947 RepID=A0AAU9LQJ2_9ASTR|nr:unnamed protein product [Lactuca virosa]
MLTINLKRTCICAFSRLVLVGVILLDLMPITIIWNPPLLLIFTLICEKYHFSCTTTRSPSSQPPPPPVVDAVITLTTSKVHRFSISSFLTVRFLTFLQSIQHNDGSKILVDYDLYRHFLISILGLIEVTKLCASMAPSVSVTAVVKSYVHDEAMLLKAYDELSEILGLMKVLLVDFDEEDDNIVDDYINFEDEHIDKI